MHSNLFPFQRYSTLVHRKAAVRPTGLTSVCLGLYLRLSAIRLMRWRASLLGSRDDKAAGLNMEPLHIYSLPNEVARPVSYLSIYILATSS